MELDHLLARLADAISDGIVITDASAHPGPVIVWCNAPFCDLVGYGMDEVLGKSPRFLQGPDTDRDTVQRISARIAAWQPVREQILNYTKEGKPFWIDLSLVPVADDTGWFHYWVGIQRDITEHMRLRDEIQAATDAERAAQQRLWLAIEAIPEAFTIYDSDDRMVAFNSRYKQLYERSAPAIRVGATFEEILRYGLTHRQYPDAIGREEPWLERRIEWHRNPGPAVEQLLPGNCHVRIQEVRTSNGDTVGFRTDITELKRQKQELLISAQALARAKHEAEVAALTDPLTHLGNRRALDARLVSMSRAAGSEAEASVLHLDLDHFKSINDAYGHAAGDRVLTYVASVLRDCVRPSDLIARVGGDEFVIVLSAPQGRELAENVARRIIGRCREPIQHGEMMLHVGASIGIATGPASDALRLLHDADIALYEAKGTGRNRSALFTPRLRTIAEERKRIADELVRALADDQITPFFQPQVASGTRALAGVEALVRWARPDGGITDPSVFLPIAEDLGVMAEIDDIMLVKSFEMVRRMAALGLEIPKISVNVSYRRLADHQLARKLGRAADWPCRVAFELLETIDFDSNSDSLLWRIDEIRERGVEIELDDFGSGRASITTLHKIRPERIKIDRQLVGTVESDLMKESPILKAIGHIAKSMGISMVAEGVETETQVRVLQRIGCDILQGFLFSPALPEADLRRWMIERPDLRVSPGASAG